MSLPSHPGMVKALVVFRSEGIRAEPACSTVKKNAAGDYTITFRPITYAWVTFEELRLA